MAKTAKASPPPARRKQQGITGAILPIQIEIPTLRSDPAKYARTHFRVNIPEHLAPTWRAVQDGLQESHERMESGKHVDSAPAAFIWLIEQVHAATRA